MAPHSSTLAWKILWTEEPGRLQSMGSLRVGHEGAASLSLFTFMHWRRKWQPTPVFLPGESQGWGRPVGCRLWGRTESDTTEGCFSEEVTEKQRLEEGWGGWSQGKREKKRAVARGQQAWRFWVTKPHNTGREKDKASVAGGSWAGAVIGAQNKVDKGLSDRLWI